MIKKILVVEILINKCGLERLELLVWKPVVFCFCEYAIGSKRLDEHINKQTVVKII
jgi:hypothetical protein